MPKKKGGKKGAKIVDGLATSEMTREQLVGHVKRIQMELDREREERNFFMLEREKLFALWNLAMEQVREQKVKARLAVEQMTEHDDEKQMELQMHKQKLRYLLTEQSKKVDEARLDNLKKMRKAQEEMLSIQTTLKEAVVQKSKEIRQAQGALHELMRQLKLENARNISEVKNKFCVEVSRLERDFLRLSLEREKREEIANENERELVKFEQTRLLEEIKSTHEVEMSKMKDYFHSVTVNNLATISALQDEIQGMKDSEKVLLQELRKSKTEFKKLDERITKDADERQNNMEKATKVSGKIQKELKRMREMQETKDKYTRSMEMANEALLQKMQLMEYECKAFKQTFTQTIMDMQQEAAMKQMILELKLQAAGRQERNQPPLPPLTDSNGVDEESQEKE
ncbi:unnamed protein product [Orchesella dallaii]|uniref:Dynein regulatory complex subunit 4 n=1 Tax=Orchesella dallaii TaxID=48710 RepID=A0ABP1R574_9HEXA